MNFSGGEYKYGLPRSDERWSSEEIFVGRRGTGLGMPPHVLQTVSSNDDPEVVILDHTQRFLATVLSACAGKPILDVINAPVTRERYDVTVIISRAFWDGSPGVGVRNREPGTTTA